MTRQERNQHKLISAEDAVRLLESGDQVVLTPGREIRVVGLDLSAHKAEALLSIAHPDFQEELRREAQRLLYA